MLLDTHTCTHNSMPASPSTTSTRSSPSFSSYTILTHTYTPSHLLVQQTKYHLPPCANNKTEASFQCRDLRDSSSGGTVQCTAYSLLPSLDSPFLSDRASILSPFYTICSGPIVISFFFRLAFPFFFSSSLFFLSFSSFHSVLPNPAQSYPQLVWINWRE